MASDTDPTQPAETKSQPGAQAHCRPLAGQEALWQGQQLLMSQSVWKCDSHSTKDCPADLNQREEKVDKGYSAGFSSRHSLLGSRCLHYLPHNENALTNEMESPLCPLCPIFQPPE